MSAVIKIFASFLYTGFFPFAPATFASGVFCALYWLVPGGEWMVHPAVCVATLVLSIPASTWMEKRYGEDPGCVVIDEVVGMQVALVMAGGVSLAGLALAFFYFRVFDILKPYPVNRSQKLPGGWGVVIDDVLAGVYTRVALILTSLFFPGIGTFM